MTETDEAQDNEFGRELRARRQAKGYSLNRLAKAVYCTPGHLSRVENGGKRPGEDLVRRCDDVLGADGELIALAVGPARDQCPYPGLAPFRAEDARWYFGREQAVSDLVCLLGDPSAAGLPTLVLGPSGVGKSSLLRAGIVPAVLAGALPTRSPRPPAVFLMTPTDRPLDSLRACAETPTALIVDQFEELFTLCADEEQREAFVAELHRLAAAGVAVVLGLRADFYGPCLAHPVLREALRLRSFPLAPMGRAQLRQAITEPAEAVGLTLEPGLAEVVLRDLDEQSGALPLLAHTLRATWQHRADGRLTLAGYERIGGVRGAVARTAEQAYSRLGPEQRVTARRILPELVRVGEGTADTRRRRDLESLAADASAEAVITEFTRSRLLTTDTGHVEISHEALLHAWPRLRKWIDADRVGLLVRQRLADDAAAWQAAGCDDSHLYRGTRLAAADEWGTRDGVEEAFLTAGRRHERRGVRRSRRLTVVFAVLAATALAAAGLATDRAWEVTRQSTAFTASLLANESDAVRGSDPALAATLALAAHRTDAGANGVRSAVIGSSAPPYATRFLADGSADATAWTAGPGGLLADGTTEGTVRIWDTRGERPYRPTAVRVGRGEIVRLAFHPARVLAVAERGGSVRLRDVHGNALHVVGRCGDADCPVAFSTDGSRLAVGDGAEGVTLWDSTEPRHPRLLRTWRTGRVVDLAVSHDGRTVVAVAAGREVQVWDAGHPYVVRGRAGDERFTKVAFGPDGRTLALADAGASGHRVLLTRLAPDGIHEVPRVIHPPAGSTVSALAFGPDGTALAVGDTDSGVRVWHVGREKDAWGLDLGQPDAVVGLAFGPDGTSLAVGTRASGSRVWSGLPPLAGHTDTVTGVESDHRGLAVTTSEDGTARLWRVPASGPPRPAGSAMTCAGCPLTGAAFSRDSRTVALTTTMSDGAERFGPSAWAAVCLWDVSSPDSPRRLGEGRIRTNGHLNAAAFTPDGRTLVTGGWGNRALVAWDISDPRRPRPRPGSAADGITSLAFLGGTGTLAVGFSERAVQLWDFRSPAAPRLITDLPGAPNAADLASDAAGRVLAAGSYDQRVHLWDVSRPTVPRVLPSLSGHKGTIWQVDLDPAGRRLLSATGVPPGPVRLWDLADLDHPHLSLSVEGPTGVGALTRDATGFLADTSDHTVRRWSTDVRSTVRELCRRSGSPLTDEEREPYRTGGTDEPCS